jgi:hypothetical protein
MEPALTVKAPVAVELRVSRTVAVETTPEGAVRKNSPHPSRSAATETRDIVCDAARMVSQPGAPGAPTRGGSIGCRYSCGRNRRRTSTRLSGVFASVGHGMGGMRYPVTTS